MHNVSSCDQSNMLSTIHFRAPAHISDLRKKFLSPPFTLSLLAYEVYLTVLFPAFAIYAFSLSYKCCFSLKASLP